MNVDHTPEGMGSAIRIPANQLGERRVEKGKRVEGGSWVGRKGDRAIEEEKERERGEKKKEKKKKEETGWRKKRKE